MHRLRLILLGTLAGLLLFRPVAAEETEDFLTLENSTGVSAVFWRGSTGWRLVRLTTPHGPADGWTVTEAGVEVGSTSGDSTLQRGWELVENASGRLVLEQEAPEAGLRLRRVFSFGPATNVLRLETAARARDGSPTLTHVGLLDLTIAEESWRETGAAPASFPAFGQHLFAGIEHTNGECTVTGDGANRLQLRHRPRVALSGEWIQLAPVVLGWRQPGVGTGLAGEAGVREAFLHYLDSVRLRPDKIVLHTDTWWTVPRPITEQNVAQEIDTLRTAFFNRTGMFFDTYCVDLGWSDPRSLWQIDVGKFPREFRALNERLAPAGASLGLWLSPGSGYPDGLSNSWLQSQGYEVLPFGAGLGQVPCFALGTRYQREVRERLVHYARQFSLGHVILDFMPLRCDVPTHGHPVGPESRYALDAGLADVLDSLRAVNPGMVLEPMVCGYPPSPWWLMKTPFVLGPAGDDMPYGRGPSPDWLESLITARDAVYRASQESWLMPTQALETFDIIVLTPGDFANTAVMAIGRGRWFLSTYFKSSLMRPEDWDFLAALVRWARANQSYLINAWQFGGRPEQRETYGYMFRHAAKDLYCARNPWIEEQTIELPAATAPGPVDVRMIYPRRAPVGRQEPGERGLTLTLAPYETVVLETSPAAENAPEITVSPRPTIQVNAPAPRIHVEPAADPERELPILRYAWSGTLQLPTIPEGELCVLVEGSRTIDLATCRILIDQQPVTPRVATSVGQFAAALEPSPDNWVWFIVPLPSGSRTFQIEVAAAQLQIAVGVYARGVTASRHDPAPEEGPVFPTLRATQRPWSQTLQPLQSIPLAADP